MKSPDLYIPAGQCCQLDEPYQAPPGYYDQPFWYVFDADSLPNGQDARYSHVKTFSGADFILRRVAGVDRCAQKFQLRDVLARILFDSVNGAFTAGFNDFPLIPEWIYPAASDITFDLLNVQKSLNSSGAFLSQIVFQGIRRFQGYKRPASYPYWNDPFDYTFDPAISFGVGTTVTFQKTIFDYDFELLEVLAMAINPIGGGPSAVASGVFKLQLYDQVNEVVFSKPVIDDLFTSNSPNYQGVLPVPGILYRIGQQIKIDVTSLVTPGVCPVQIQIRCKGVRRRPCR